MNLLEEIQLEKRKQKARNLRYKQPVCKNINLENILCFCAETMEAASEVAYASENEDVLIKALGGDEGEAFEFRTAFSTLETDVEQFANDLEEEWVQECFDLFFAGIGGDGGGLMGFDEFEGDYFGLNGFESNLAVQEAGKKLARYTKAQLLEIAGRCMRIAVCYLALQSRYEDLRAALDILRDKHEGMIKTLTRINDLYVDAEREGFGGYNNKAEQELDKLISELPDECWIR